MERHHYFRPRQWRAISFCMKTNFTLAILASSLAALGQTTLLIDDISPKQPESTLTKYDLQRIEAAKQKRIRRAQRKK